MGGPLVSTSGEELVRNGIVDISVIGEGESTFNLYLESVSIHGDFENIPGIIYKQDDQVISNPPGSYLENINETIPAWDLIQPDHYFTRLRRSTQSVIMKSHKSVSILHRWEIIFHQIVTPTLSKSGYTTPLSRL